MTTSARSKLNQYIQIKIDPGLVEKMVWISAEG